MGLSKLGDGRCLALEDVYPRPRYGRSYEIRVDPISGVVIHVNGTGYGTPTTVRSHPEGVVIGCAFLTTGALKKIYEWHESYINSNPMSTTHQSGN